jgi:predicted nucleic acid-binding Zn ribbon protein
MICPSCGKEMPDDSTFCPACGAKSSSGKKEDRPRIIMATVIILVLLAVFLATHPGNRAGAKLIPYRQGDQWGFCDRNTNLVIPAVYDSVDPFSEGLAGVTVSDKCGFINTKGKMVIPAIYDGEGNFSEGLACAGFKDKGGFINTKGTMVIPAVYDDAWSFSNGLASVKLNGKWGYIDTKGTQYWEG